MARGAKGWLMAHVQKVTTRGGKVRFQARYLDPTGKERAKNFVTRAEARSFVLETESSKLRGEWMAPELGRRTFAEWAERTEASRHQPEGEPALAGRLDREGPDPPDLWCPADGLHP